MSVIPIRNLGVSGVSKKYLYFKGNEQTAVTGGWTSAGYKYSTYPNDNRITLGDKVINANSASSISNMSVFGTGNPISLIGKNQVRVHFSSMTFTVGVGLSLIVSNTKTPTLNAIYGSGSGTSTDYTITYDISNVAQSNVYLMLLNSSNNNWCTIGTIDYIEVI